MPSPPKPWERAGATAAAADPPPLPASSSTAPVNAVSSPVPQPASAAGNTGDLPSIPSRPASLNSLARPMTTAGGLGGLGTTSSLVGGSPYGTSSYSSGYNSYGGTGYSPYNRFGSGYGSGYGGYGSGYGGYSSYGSPYNRFGSGYGGYGSGYGGYGGYGGRPGFGGFGAGQPGQPLPNGELPLTARVEQSTALAFQTIDQIVQTFGGFAQMLESTFFATHSSFMAMVGVAEQLGHLRGYLGRALAAFSFLHTLRRWIYARLGWKMPSPNAEALSPDAFDKFNKEAAEGGGNGAGAKGRRPFWLFVLLLVGLPWLMSKLISRLQRMALEEAGKVLDPNNPQKPASGAAGQQSQMQQQLLLDQPLSASQIKDLEFCRALYDFRGENPSELSFSRGDIIAILSKEDPSTRQPSMWWRGRLRSGPIGYFPANYVEVIEKRTGGAAAAAPMPVPAGAGGAPMLPNGSAGQGVPVPGENGGMPIPAEAGSAFSPDEFNLGNAF
ncbi:Peroxisomal membrane protein PAS20 [Phlyctochytrium bullatum]|nr:Peroxisomal membrane protein PAS20 [Phlyctochytrium bullatum]